MDTTIIEVRKNVLITNTIADGSTSFTASIKNVSFIPDAVIVRMIGYNSALALPHGTTVVTGFSAYPDNRVVNISTNLVDDTYIGCVTDVGVCMSNLIFTINKPINGIYLFSLTTPDGVAFNLVGDLSIFLEFVKFKRLPLQNIN
jgi:hypothetical protein